MNTSSLSASTPPPQQQPLPPPPPPPLAAAGGALGNTDDAQGEAIAEAQEKAADEGRQQHADNASTGAAVIGEELADRARAALKIQSVWRGQAKRAEYLRDKDARRQWVTRYIAVSKYEDATKPG
eukprot:scaffold111054_cov80-Phaeocystis_antarctica.AAC.1